MIRLPRMNVPRRAMLALTAVLLATAPAAASEQRAVDFLRGLGDKAVALASTGGAEPLAKREARLLALLEEGFDVELIARFVLGRYWNRATPDQRSTYTNLFKEFIVLTFARRFQDYNGETFEISGTVPRGETDHFVKTLVRRPNAADVAVDWRVRCKSECRVIDVVAEGISQVATYRSEYGGIIQNGGGRIDALIEALNARVSQLKSQ